ncbi:PAH-inducible cytochrome P450 monooxygenase PC-PAH 4 [Trametes meyenii]|nr:PAH-inducible cytochrome P450 monooxygenase PC-PAH 4 [Trametes meyenii]
MSPEGHVYNLLWNTRKTVPVLSLVYTQELTYGFVGHEYDLSRQREVGDLEFKWLREYGSTWRIRGPLATNSLMTADPKALQHIFQKAAGNYMKKTSQNHVAWLLAGPGIGWAQGEAHTRHRRIMNPAFSNARLKSFLPIFQRVGSKLVEKWKAELFSADTVQLWLNTWLSRATLDIIGEVAFDHDYRALDDADQSVLAKEYHGILKDTEFRLPVPTMFFRATWDYLPMPLLKLFKYIPMDPFTRLRNLNNLFSNYGRRILFEKRPEFDVELDTKSRDIMSILIKANASTDAKMRLNDEELLAEMFTLTIAGHETTSMALAFLLYELARHPKYQDRLRKDIREARARANARGDSDLTIEDLDGIPSLTNAIKESLRMHPGGAMFSRVAENDDVIPLAFPMVSTTGEMIAEIPVKTGDVIVASFASYQRLSEVWGEDADVWNPDRFSRLDIAKQTNVGMFANLMTFSGGPNACIGWRFAVIEQQTLIAQLVDTFEFHLPEGVEDRTGSTEVIRAPSGSAMIPMVRDRPELGSGLRLRISFAPE